jgi:RNA polymerase sigma-70 factor (ECF subfamily)
MMSKGAIVNFSTKDMPRDAEQIINEPSAEASASQHVGAAGDGNPHLRFTREMLPHLGDALALAQCLTGARATATDLVQEAFTLAYVTVEDFASSNARVWILTMVFSAWLNRDTAAPAAARQALGRAPQRADKTPWADASAALALAPEQSTGQSTGHAILDQSIAALPAVFREVLLLRKQGLSYNRISEVVGVPIGTVLSRLARARRRIKQSVGNAGA